MCEAELSRCLSVLLLVQPSAGMAQLSPSLASLSLQSQTPEALRVVNLLQERSLLPAGAVTPPTPCLPQDLQKLNCSPESVSSLSHALAVGFVRLADGLVSSAGFSAVL